MNDKSFSQENKMHSELHRKTETNTNWKGLVLLGKNHIEAMG